MSRSPHRSSACWHAHGTRHMHVGMHMEPSTCMCWSAVEWSGVAELVYALSRHATQGAAQSQTGTAGSSEPPEHDALQTLASPLPSYTVPSPMHRSNPLYAQSPPAPAAAAAPPPLRPAGLTPDASVGHTSCHAAAAQQVAVTGCRASPCGMSLGVGVCRCSSACSSCVLLLLVMRASSAAAMPAQQQCRAAPGQTTAVLGDGSTPGRHAPFRVHGCCLWC